MVSAFALALLAARQDPASCCDPMSPFAADPAFVAAHKAPLPLRFAPSTGKEVTFDATDAKPAGGFYVAPKKPGAPAIVVIHEWWGLNDYVRREAETLNDRTGYGVLAIDLYDGKVAKTPEEAGKLMQGVQPNRASAIVSGAIKTLKAGKLGDKFAKLGTLGWCFGGGWSHQTAIEGGDSVKACVMYYGMPDTKPEDLARLKAPVLMVWATKDKWINEKVVTDFKSAMAKAKKPLTVLAYPDDHGFANPSNPNHDKANADKAMAQTLAFFKKNLG